MKKDLTLHVRSSLIGSYPIDTGLQTRPVGRKGECREGAY